MKSPNVWAKPSDLKPCPFCGSADIKNVSAGHAGPTNLWHAGDEIFAVNCKDCGASVPNRYRNNLVVEAWNTRPTQAAQPSQAGELSEPELEAACKAAASHGNSLGVDSRHALAIVAAYRAAINAKGEK